MIKNILTHIGGVEIYGIISILLFFVFFVGMLIWAFRLNRGQLESMRGIPLEDGTGAARTNPPLDSSHE